MDVHCIAEVRRAHGRIADLAKVRASVSRDGPEPRAAMMSTAEMGVTEAMTVAAAMMTTAVMAATTMVPAAVPTPVVPAPMATAAALGQRRARQHADKRHRGNSNDRSQHRILPQSRAIEASELVGNWNRRNCRKFPTAGEAGALGYCLSMIFSENRCTLFRIVL
ncbi:hypothetical protein [Bradyrhizobium iriomotense]|uniref:hypothetical protein n=1 Tax=Bradyrhizobium iriomotense TaxID=441950 RepID=UPI0024E091D7|nr:hypothetical protein [Bradyrhizobium iriomotense]